MNALDHALFAAKKTASAMPDLYRELGAGELFLLMPKDNKKEIGDAVQLENGMPFPFVMLKDEEGEIVPIFSSEERAQEGLARGKVPPNTILIGSMLATQALEVVGQCGLRAIVNQSCTTPSFILPPDLLRDIASGKVFQPMPGSGKRHRQNRLSIIDPADYPTGIVQPAFEVLRKFRNFRAAWIFLDGEVAEQNQPVYQMLLLMDPRDAEIHHELNMVIAALYTTLGADIRQGFVDETDPVYIAELFRQAKPFYLAADFGGGK